MYGGLNYLSLYHAYETSEANLRRDFELFRLNNIYAINLSLYWYRIEGDTQGDYHDSFLENIKRICTLAREYRVKVLITFHTLWGGDSPWCTPDYVIDPVYGQKDALAIVRDPTMRQAFINMFTYAVQYLSGTPNIKAWCILNEPWYWPHELPPPYENIDQKENFITLMQELSNIVKTYDGRPVTVRFVFAHTWNGNAKNIFEEDWGWDQRIFDVLDFISANIYLPLREDPVSTQVINIVKYNISGCYTRKKNVWITEFGYSSEDDSKQQEAYRYHVKFFRSRRAKVAMAWMYMSEVAPPGWDQNPGFGGFNLATPDGTPRPAFYEIPAPILPIFPVLSPLVTGGLLYSMSMWNKKREI